MDPPGVPDSAPPGQAPTATPLSNPSAMHAPLPGVAWMSAACLTCGYSLARLPAGPCPECGRMFDPADPNTVGPRGSSRFWLWVSAAAWLCTPGPVYGGAGVGTLYLIAWAVLGRPPQPWVHDPQSIPGVASLHTLVLLALIFSPLLTALEDYAR